MDWRVRSVVAHLQHNFHQEFLLDELARSVNLSLSRLHHLFKAQTGTSLASYLRELRRNKCQELLETTALSVKEIMIAVGINDRSHFERDFKVAYGLTPVQYRAAARLVSSAEECILQIAETAIK
jgi:transcriptional regulator GlxA family with amidase domain